MSIKMDIEMIIKIVLWIIAIGAVIFGFYEMFIDNEKGVAYASFVFSVVAFLISQNLTEIVSFFYKPAAESESVVDVSDEKGEEVTDTHDPISSFLKLSEDTNESNQDSIENDEEDKSSDETDKSSDEIDKSSDKNNEVSNKTDDISNKNNSEIGSKTTEIVGNSFSGNIIADDQKDQYKYIPDISGIYRFDFDSNDANSNYEFYIYSSNGELLADSSYLSEGKTIELTAGEQYNIVVIQNSGKTEYKITIGVPNNISTVDGTTIAGKITYTNQKNEYLYTAPMSGRYRFDFSISDVQCDYTFGIYASNNEELALSNCSSGGRTIDLVEGETYTIAVEQESGFFDYSISIGVPNAEQSIDGNSFSGSITYTDQFDRYVYTAPVNGVYRFDFISDNAQCDYIFYLYASNNEELASTYYSNAGQTVELVAGQTYRIEVEQESGFENYTINIGVPNNIVNVEGDVITGDITYTNQENVYKYIPPVSGEYTFSFGTNNVDADYEFNIDSPINENIVSTYCSRESETVQLEEGQEYTITVKQSTDFASYQINIITQ